MKKIFTLMALAGLTMNVSAQTESYKSIVVDGDAPALAPEFAAVVDENNVATNVGTTGRSVVTFGTANMSVEAVGSATPTDVEPGEEINAELHLFEPAAITMGDITWKNGNNKLDINDAEQTKLYFVMGQGNAYEEILAEEIYTDDEPTGRYRPYYTYTDYLNGDTGLPKYGLYYKFTPTLAGTLKVQVWVNKGNRNTVVVKGSTGAAMTYGEDYWAEGYVNGKRANYDTPAIDPETGEPKLDNQGNPIYEQYQIFFNREQIDSIHNDYCYGNYYKLLRENEEEPGKHSEDKVAEEKAKGDQMAIDRRFVISTGNQAFWGWITIPVEAGESYYLFQLSSQLGFGGYDFTFDGSEGISNMELQTVAKHDTYNLNGQKVGAGYKGIIMKDGKKLMSR
jgi:hypothetical protein